jgi:hypothetical protein
VGTTRTVAAFNHVILGSEVALLRRLHQSLVPIPEFRWVAGVVLARVRVIESLAEPDSE